jgi:hypothetical protein
MKTIILVVGLLFFTNMLVNAQVTKVTTSTHLFDEHTIVNDSAANRLPFDVWHAILISGNYSLKSNGNFSDTTAFHIHRMTKAEKDLNNSLLCRKAENQLSQLGQNAIPSQVNILQPPRPPESPSFKMGDKPTSFRANDINEIG